MNLLSHRGLWGLNREKNSMEALNYSFQCNIGIETDIRDFDGKLVISHDPPSKSAFILLDDLLRAYVNSGHRPVLGLNIKADGIQNLLMESLSRFSVDNYFVFDMSLPDTLGYVKLQMPFAVRLSEYEVENELMEIAPWVWLDCFEGNWFSARDVEKLLMREKRVAVVSPQLHNREPTVSWEMLRHIASHPNIYLCTDLINEAREFFNE